MQILQWVKKQTGKIADNVKDYKFFVKHQPSFIDSSTTIVLTTYSNRDEVATIPCIFKWSRIKNGLTNQVPEFKGSSFICEPSDIGSIIQVEITSTDPHHPGTAILKFGPVKFDVMIKKQIEHSLAAKSATFNIDLVQKNDSKECQVRINDDTIRVSHSHSNNQYTFDYNMSEPRIQASIKQPTKVHINFNEKYQDEVRKFINQMFGFEDLSASLKNSNEHRLELQFPTRAAKDKFLYVIKAYVTRKAIKNAAVIQKIEDHDFNPENNFNTMLQIESLRADLVKLARLNEKYLADKKMYHEEARKLQQQIQQIIVTYTKIAQGKCKDVTDLDQSVMQLREKKDQVMERKLHALMHQNQVLRDRIQFLNEQAGVKPPQQGMIKSQSLNDSPLANSGRGGFIKKRQVQQVPANHFNTILQKLDESEVREPSPLQDQVRNLTQEKSYLAKKLNQSVMKIAKLQEKVKKAKLNNTAINLEMGNQTQMSIDVQKANVSAFQLGEDRNKIYAQMEQLKKSNIKLLAENKRLRSDIPLVSSKDQQYRLVKKSEQVSQINNKSVNEAQSARVQQSFEQASLQKSFAKSQLNPQVMSSSIGALKKRIRQLEEENQRLKDQISMLNIEKDVITKQKSAIETKYKKKISEMMNQNSMYRRNQDALNRSQNLSMQMDQYNQQQCNLYKQQNQILTQQNERLQKLCQKYIKEAKQIPKLRQQILTMKTAKQASNDKKNDLSYSKSNDDILLYTE